jgi:TetR/AcrR family transcriptional regulator, cholesterol catabolism regulator
VATAARRFAEAGPDAVRLDDIADGADVARGTLYSHFRTKDALLCAIVEPVLRLAVRKTRALGRANARDGVGRLLGLYLDLWHAYPDALRIAYKAQDMPIGDLGALHRAFLSGVLRVFARAQEAGILRSGDPLLAGHVMRQVAVPLLELYGRHADGDRLFVEGLSGLLVTEPTGLAGGEETAGPRRPAPRDARAVVSSRRSRGGSGRAS